MIRKTIIKIALPISLLLLFILSCDERSPVAFEHAPVAYQLELFLDNDSCEPSENTYFCTDANLHPLDILKNVFVH